jgi:uncharacterized protein
MHAPRPALVQKRRRTACGLVQEAAGGAGRWLVCPLQFSSLTSTNGNIARVTDSVLPAITPLWTETLRGGTHWSWVIRRGHSLRLTAQGADANVAALFYSREQPLERYNMADTLKAQHTAHLTTGCVCYSDMGRVLAAITADTLGWHDPLCGLTRKEALDAQYGATSYQQQRNQRYVSGHEAMLVELGKYGLGERDLVANINFFSKVMVDGNGGLALATGHSDAGDAVDLRFEMDCIVLLHAGPHPLAKGSRYAPPDIGVQAFRSEPVVADDPCRRRCPENERGYINTERYVAA